jgi:hypothetical protein
MIFLGVVWVLGWRVAVSEEMIFEKIGKWAEKKEEEGWKIMSGLVLCPWCLPNIHGILFVWPLAWALEILPHNMIWWKYLAMYPFYLGASSYIAGMLWNIYLTLNQVKDSNEASVDWYKNGQKYFYNINKKIKDGNTKEIGKPKQ